MPMIALVALLAGFQAVATDQTVPVQPGTRLDVENLAGDVRVDVWNRDEVRVRVEGPERDAIEVRPAGQTLRVRARTRRPQRRLDYTITVPAWMPVAVSGRNTDVRLDGVGSDVTVEITRGDVDVRGGSGLIALKAVQGAIAVARAKGRVDVVSVNESIRLSEISGDITAQTTNGSIVLDRIESSSVDLHTVNGRVSYDGPIRDKGVYRLATHNGSIALTVAEQTNASVRVRTYNGAFRSTFPVKADDERDRERGRFTLTLGNGSARVELESFNGSIAVRRPGEPPPEPQRGRDRNPRPREPKR